MYLFFIFFNIYIINFMTFYNNLILLIIHLNNRFLFKYFLVFIKFISFCNLFKMLFSFQFLNFSVVFI